MHSLCKGHTNWNQMYHQCNACFISSLLCLSRSPSIQACFLCLTTVYLFILFLTAFSLWISKIKTSHSLCRLWLCRVIVFLAHPQPEKNPSVFAMMTLHMDSRVCMNWDKLSKHWSDWCKSPSHQLPFLFSDTGSALKILFYLVIYHLSLSLT